MKTLLKSLFLAAFVVSSLPTQAQLLKKLKNKIESKVEQKVEQEMDKTIDNLGKTKPKRENDTSDGSPADRPGNGNAFLDHGNKYGKVAINELGKAVAQINDTEVRIYGSWVTMAADIQDGYVLTVPEGASLLFEGKDPVKKQVTLSIPAQARLELSYDPVWDAKTKDENGLAPAVTKEYQSFELASGTVTIDVFSKENVQIAFSGTCKLVTRTDNPDKNSEEKYLLSYSDSSISGSVDVGPVNVVDNRTLKKKKSNNQDVSVITMTSSNEAAPAGAYSFNFESKVKITNMDDGSEYKMSYLINNSQPYVGLKMNMADYSEAEVTGESVIIVDGEDTHIFVESQGMKFRMSQNMTGANQAQNPVEQMADYDYSGVQKTGNTKTILGATCHEYVMSDSQVKITLWVAPEVKLPNWFIQGSDVIDGHIMEYEINSKEGNMKSETIALQDNINKILNPKEYRKMF